MRAALAWLTWLAVPLLAAPPILQQADIPVSNRSVRVLYTVPRCEGAPAVVDLHGSGWHVDNNVDNLRRWIRYGYTGIDVEYTQDVDALSVQQVLATLAWARDTLKAGRVGLHGYSLGARVAFQVAVCKAPLAALSGMAGRVKLWDGTQPVLDHVLDIHCPVLIQHGDEDQTVPVENAVQLSQALQQTGIDFECYLYRGAGHRLDLTPAVRDRVETFMRRWLDQ